METISDNCTTIPIDYLNEIVAGVGHRQDAVAVAYGCICVIGIAANFVLLWSLLAGGKRGATFKTPSIILIVNLAIADMLLLLTLPFAIIQRLQRRWLFGRFMCKLEEGVKFLNYYGSIFFITAMAVDRYLSLCRPATHTRRVARRSMWLVCIMLWILALLFVTPLMIFADVDGYDLCNIIFPGSQMPSFNTTQMDDYTESESPCFGSYDDLFYSVSMESNDTANYENENFTIEDLLVAVLGDVEEMTLSCLHPPVFSLHLWLVCNFIIGFVVPFCVISGSYVKIMMLKTTVYKVTSARETTDQAMLESQETTVKPKCNVLYNQRAKVILGVLIPCLILAFAACWLPYHTWHLAQISGIPGLDSNKCNLIRDITFCLAFCNSALNPILNFLFLFNLKAKLFSKFPQSELGFASSEDVFILPGNVYNDRRPGSKKFLYGDAHQDAKTRSNIMHQKTGTAKVSQNATLL